MATETSSMRRSSGRAIRWGAFVVLSAIGLALDGTTASAQRRPARRQATIEIRGTVPTPQVVTVRPREVPAYSRQVLVPRFYDHDFWPEIQEGYAIMSNRMMTPGDSLVLAADSVGTPDLFRLPTVSALTPLRAQFGYLHKQYEWCAPHWWCPSHRVRVRVPADSSALFPPRLPPQPMAVAPGNANPTAPNQLPVVQQRWCATHWWCPPGGVVNTPASTTPGTTTTPADTTRRPPPTPPDSTRRPPGTSSASRH
jgi:hypothetical protein